MIFTMQVVQRWWPAAIPFYSCLVGLVIVSVLVFLMLCGSVHPLGRLVGWPYKYELFLNRKLMFTTQIISLTGGFFSLLLFVLILMTEGSNATDQDCRTLQIFSSIAYVSMEYAQAVFLLDKARATVDTWGATSKKYATASKILFGFVLLYFTINIFAVPALMGAIFFPVDVPEPMLWICGSTMDVNMSIYYTLGELTVNIGLFVLFVWPLKQMIGREKEMVQDVGASGRKERIVKVIKRNLFASIAVCTTALLAVFALAIMDPVLGYAMSIAQPLHIVISNGAILFSTINAWKPSAAGSHHSRGRKASEGNSRITAHSRGLSTEPHATELVPAASIPDAGSPRSESSTQLNM